MNSPNRFTEEEMSIARSTDLPSLLESLGYSVVRKGRFHSTKEMDSLMIKDRIKWFRYSEQVGGDTITFLQHFNGMSFPEAVNALLAFNGYSRDAPTPIKPHFTKSSKEEKTEFKLPPPSADNRRVYTYLKKRGIAHQVISAFLDSGLLYEDAEHHNCIFVGKDKTGTPVFAYKRGTYGKDGSGFKGDVPGSDKAVAFSLPCDPEKDSVCVFESPIDLASYMTINRELNSNAVALCCLHDGALETYLKDNPHIKNIVLRLDADKWGKTAAEHISEKYSALGFSVSVESPAQGKDWNEYLQIKNAQKRERSDAR